MAAAYASRLGLIAFGATAFEAACAGTDLIGGVTTALVRLAMFYGLGLVCGGIAGRLAEEQARQDLERWIEAAEAPAAAMT